MGSSSQQATTTTNNNLAVDASATLGEGQQIFDSVIVDASPDVVKAAMQEMAGSFEVMMGQNSANLNDVVIMAETVMGYANAGQVELTGAAYKQLESGLEFLTQAQEQGKAVLELARDTQAQSFGLAEDVVDGNDERLAQALELVADVRAPDSVTMVRLVSFTIMASVLGALLIITRNR